MNIEKKTFSTGQLASLVGVHGNTLRFYEEMGFLTKPERQPNGYRIYTRLHLDQCRLIRRAMRAEVIQNDLRQKAVDIVRLCAALDFDGAETACGEYRAMIDAELRSAQAAILAVEDVLRRREPANSLCLKRREAAASLGVTPETLRTWERSGLLSVARRENGYRVYSAGDMRRLNMIRTLRCANYSLSAILRLMSGLEHSEPCSVEATLDTPQEDEDIISVCDRLISSLHSTREDAEALLSMIAEMGINYISLQ